MLDPERAKDLFRYNMMRMQVIAFGILTTEVVYIFVCSLLINRSIIPFTTASSYSVPDDTFCNDWIIFLYGIVFPSSCIHTKGT